MMPLMLLKIGNTAESVFELEDEKTLILQIENDDKKNKISISGYTLTQKDAPPKELVKVPALSGTIKIGVSLLRRKAQSCNEQASTHSDHQKQTELMQALRAKARAEGKSISKIVRDITANYTERTSDDLPMSCSFCGKAKSEVNKLIAGPLAYICDECARLCIHIMENE